MKVYILIYHDLLHNLFPDWTYNGIIQLAPLNSVNSGRRLKACQWRPPRTWEWNILPELRFSWEKGGDKFHDRFLAWRSCTQYFGRKISRHRFHNRKKVEQKLITTNIRFTNGLRSVWGSYPNTRYLSNSLHICDAAFHDRSYTCDPLPYSSDHLPTHALLRKVMMETGRVQRINKKWTYTEGITLLCRISDPQWQRQPNGTIWRCKARATMRSEMTFIFRNQWGCQGLGRVVAGAEGRICASASIQRVSRPSGLVWFNT